MAVYTWYFVVLFRATKSALVTKEIIQEASIYLDRFSFTITSKILVNGSWNIIIHFNKSMWALKALKMKILSIGSSPTQAKQLGKRQFNSIPLSKPIKPTKSGSQELTRRILLDTERWVYSYVKNIDSLWIWYHQQLLWNLSMSSYETFELNSQWQRCFKKMLRLSRMFKISAPKNF